jgi:hypothetical protein
MPPLGSGKGIYHEPNKAFCILLRCQKYEEPAQIYLQSYWFFRP